MYDFVLKILEDDHEFFKLDDYLVKVFDQLIQVILYVLVVIGKKLILEMYYLQFPIIIQYYYLAYFIQNLSSIQ